MPFPFHRSFIRFLFLSWVALFAIALAGGAEFLGVEEDEIRRVIDLGYNLDDRMVEEIERMKIAYPDSPVPEFIAAGRLYWLQAYAEWDKELSDQFEEAIEHSLEKASDYADAHDEEVDAEFMVAMNQLLQVIYLVDNRRWWAAFWRLRPSLKTMRKVLESDPDYHDAKMPMGMANCYMSKTPGYLKPLAFLMRFSGDMDLGMRYMEEAKTDGLFTRADAGYYLGTIYIELHDDLEKSALEIERLAKLYPNNLQISVSLARLERRLERHESARNRLLGVLDSDALESYPAIEAGAYFELMWSALGSGDFELALETCDKVEAFAKNHKELAKEVIWASHARAEALYAQGRRDEAEKAWKSVSKQNRSAYDAAQRRIRETKATRDEEERNSLQPLDKGP